MLEMNILYLKLYIIMKVTDKFKHVNIMSKLWVRKYFQHKKQSYS